MPNTAMKTGESDGSGNPANVFGAGSISGPAVGGHRTTRHGAERRMQIGAAVFGHKPDQLGGLGPIDRVVDKSPRAAARSAARIASTRPGDATASNAGILDPAPDLFDALTLRAGPHQQPKNLEPILLSERAKLFDVPLHYDNSSIIEILYASRDASVSCARCGSPLPPDSSLSASFFVQSRPSDINFPCPPRSTTFILQFARGSSGASMRPRARRNSDGLLSARPETTKRPASTSCSARRLAAARRSPPSCGRSTASCSTPHAIALRDEVSVLYVSPLKALANDIRLNLEEPLHGVRDVGAESGLDLSRIRAGLRTGDTSASERTAMLRRPPHILVTTPESLFILLTSPKFREKLASVRHVIVDELHALAGNKRGAHLALTLERLERFVTSRGNARPNRIGLSATLNPIEKLAGFLAGYDVARDNSRTAASDQDSSRRRSRPHDGSAGHRAGSGSRAARDSSALGGDVRRSRAADR